MIGQELYTTDSTWIEEEKENHLKTKEQQEYLGSTVALTAAKLK